MILELDMAEIESIKLSLLADLYINHRLPAVNKAFVKLTADRCERDWLLLEKITGKTRLQIAEREK